MNTRNCIRSCAAIVAVTAVASCSRAPESVWTDDSGLLKYVPADTPYVFAQGEEVPDELMDKLQPWTESIFTAYLEMGRSILADAAVNAA